MVGASGSGGITIGPTSTESGRLPYKYHRSRLLLPYFTLLPMKMEPIEGSETSEFINQTPGNYPKGNLLHVTVLNTVGNCNTMLRIVIVYYNIMGHLSFMRSVVYRNVVMRRVPVF